MVGENHLISVSTTSGPALAETFVYDGDGNRVSQTINGVSTNFLVDTNNLTGYAQVLEEIQGSSIQKAYTYGVSRISEDAFNGSSYTTSYYGYDGQGSVRFLMDSTGKVTDQYTYTSFGENLFASGSTSNAFQYDGEQMDSNTRFYYLRARYHFDVVLPESRGFLIQYYPPPSAVIPPELERLMDSTPTLKTLSPNVFIYKYGISKVHDMDIHSMIFQFWECFLVLVMFHALGCRCEKCVNGS